MTIVLLFTPRRDAMHGVDAQAQNNVEEFGYELPDTHTFTLATTGAYIPARLNNNNMILSDSTRGIVPQKYRKLTCVRAVHTARRCRCTLDLSSLTHAPKTYRHTYARIS